METKLYKRRWLQLILFFIYAGCNMMQWIQFTIIGNIISRYYGVSSLAVDWTSIIFLATYVVLMFPASYVMDRVGLRWSCLIGCIGTSVGSWIKVFSVSPDYFIGLFFGQTIVAASAIFALNGPASLAANWFGQEEIATATSIGCLGGSSGASLLFLIAPIVVNNHEKIEDIGKELSSFFLTVATISTIITVTLFFFFQDEPRLPPSGARAIQRMKTKVERKSFLSTFQVIATNKSFILLWNTYGINLGFFNAVCTLLNPFFLAHFKNGEVDAGRLGLTMTFVGNIGTIFFGLILDKTKKFKALNKIIFALTLVGEILFAVGLMMEIKWLVFLSVSVIGVSCISYSSTGFELSAEVTYPEPEELPSAILNLAQEIYGIILTTIVAILLRTYGDTAAHGSLIVILLVGLILTMIIKIDLNRQNATKITPYQFSKVNAALLDVVKSDEIINIKINKL